MYSIDLPHLFRVRDVLNVRELFRGLAQEDKPSLSLYAPLQSALTVHFFVCEHQQDYKF